MIVFNVSNLKPTVSSLSKVVAKNSQVAKTLAKAAAVTLPVAIAKDLFVSPEATQKADRKKGPEMCSDYCMEAL